MSCAVAKEVLAKRIADAAEGRFFPGRVANRRTVNAIADQWWEDRGRFLRSKSWACYLARIRPQIGALPVSAVTAAEVQKIINAEKEKNSASSANRVHTLLSSIFSWARRARLFYGENPCSCIKREKEPRHLERYLSAEEWGRLLATAEPRLRPVLVCAVKTGMRRGEILALEWQHVDLEAGVIHVAKSKSGQSRKIPITESLRGELEGLGAKAGGSVFGLPVISLRRLFERALRYSGVSCRFHDLRHTFASHFIMRTSDLSVLQHILGHSTPAMTLRYAHLSKGHLASDMAAFETALAVGRLEASGDLKNSRRRHEQAT